MTRAAVPDENGSRQAGYVQARKRYSGRAGATATKTTLARRMRREMTPAEAALWAAVRRDGLGAPCRRQHVIRGWIVDFFVPAASLAIEVDGEVHRESRDADQERDEVLQDLGIEVVRFRNEEIQEDLPRVVELLREKVRERLSPLRQTPPPSPLPSKAGEGELPSSQGHLSPLSGSAGEGPGEGS